MSVRAFTVREIDFDDMIVRTENGFPHIESAGDQILASLELLTAESPWVTVKGDVVTFRAVNETVKYRVFGWEPRSYALMLERLP